MNDLIDTLVNPSSSSEIDQSNIQCTSASKADFSVPNKDWQAEDSTTVDNSVNDNTSNTDNNSNNSNSGTGSAVNINATIDDTATGTKYVATKIAVNAFTIPQSYKDAHYLTNEIPILIYVTAYRASDSGVIASVSDIGFYAPNDTYKEFDYSYDTDIQIAAQNAGYTVTDNYGYADQGSSISGWVVLIVDPSVNKDNLVMQYNQMAYNIIGGSGGTIPAQKIAVNLGNGQSVTPL
jgi:hypothetical protein